MDKVILYKIESERKKLMNSKNRLEIKDILKSINILYDSENASRISHFQPTTKAVVLIDSLLGLKKDKAYFISAPYGSGKSITSTYLLHSVENRESSKDVLQDLHTRVEEIAPKTGDFLNQRLKNGDKGIVLAFQGYQEDINTAIKHSLSESLKRHGLDSTTLLKDIKFNKLDNILNSIIKLISSIDRVKFDRISIIWDEFGRHIEGLIEDGQQSKLNQLQTMAEFASRSEIPFTLGLLLHQSLMNYAGKTPQSVKKEWKKIEGRYETIQYVDDSKEIYNLIANVINNISNDFNIDFSYENVIKVFHSNKVFLEFNNNQLSKLFKHANPLTPIALYILPKLSSRIAQHERTLFTFLNSVNFDEPITVSTLYDYFSDTMSKDTTVGGVYHQWSVTESAISKIDNEDEIEILKTLSLLNIAMAVDKGRVSKDLLKVSLSYSDKRVYNLEKQIDSLLQNKLLLYRKNTDSITIWHGTEVDLFGRLTEEKDKLSSSFDVLEFVEENFEPTHWKPVEYNNKFKVHRYFKSKYIGFESLKTLLNEDLNKHFETTFDDGRIYFFLPSTDDELVKGMKLISEHGKHKQIIWATPKNKLELFDIALEVSAYNRMLEDSNLIESDPFIEKEINQLLDDVMVYLQRIIESATLPSLKGPSFIYNGKILNITSSKTLRSKLSEITTDIFCKTPILNNEMVVKKNLRSTLVNGRKKLILAILESSGEKDLALEGFTPDVSMFRSLLLNSGLYQKVGENNGVDNWIFSKPNDLNESGLKGVWVLFQQFFTEPGENKRFSELFNKLKQPPIGLRNGVIPILLASATRAFPSILSITHITKGYLTDILASDIENICNYPDEYLLSVESLDDIKGNFLKDIYKIFSPKGDISSREKDLIRKCYDAIEMWKSTLPTASMTSRRITQDTRIFQELVRDIKNPRNMFFKQIPSKYNSTNLEVLTTKVKQSKDELEGITDAYYLMAAKSILNAIQMPSHSIDELPHAIGLWISYLPQELFKSFKDSIAKALLMRLRMQYDDEKKLIDSIAGLLIGKPVSKWEDSTITVFEREFQENVHRIEDFVLGNVSNKHLGKAHKNLADLAVTRIDSLFRKVVDLVGNEEEARKLISEKIGG